MRKLLAIACCIVFAAGATLAADDEKKKESHWTDKIKIGGFKLGFWFSQQGSILVFVVIIFVYVRLMNRLDREFRVRENNEAKK